MYLLYSLWYVPTVNYVIFLSLGIVRRVNCTWNMNDKEKRTKNSKYLFVSLLVPLPSLWSVQCCLYEEQLYVNCLFLSRFSRSSFHLELSFALSCSLSLSLFLSLSSPPFPCFSLPSPLYISLYLSFDTQYSRKSVCSVSLVFFFLCCAIIFLVVSGCLTDNDDLLQSSLFYW